MHTRSHLILQDLSLLKQFGKSLSVGVSLTTDDEEIRAQFEPHAPSISRRLQLIRKLRESGVEVYVSMSPLLPCDPDRLISLVAPYVSKVWIDTMRWTEVNTHPQLLEKYKEFFEQKNYEATVNYIASRFPHRRTSEPPLSPVQVEPAAEILHGTILPPAASHKVIGAFDPAADYLDVLDTSANSLEQDLEKDSIIDIIAAQGDSSARLPQRAAALKPQSAVVKKPQKKLVASSATQLKLPFG